MALDNQTPFGKKNLSVGALEKKSWFSKEEVFLGDSATIFADAAAIF